MDSAAIGALLLWTLYEGVRGLPYAATGALEPEATGAVLDATLHHGVAPSVGRALRQLQSSIAVSSELRARLDSMRAQVVAQHLRVLAELSELSGCLDATGVPWVVFKGPAVAGLGYRDPSLRGYVDLDILVEPAGFADVLESLEASGASLQDHNWELQRRAWRSEISWTLRYGTHLDLHWHPVNDRRARSETSLDVAAFLARRRQVSLSGPTCVPVLDATDHLLVVALHAALSGGHRLQWVKDLEQMVRNDPPDWDDFVDRARRARIALPAALMLQRAERLLGAPVPEDLGAHLLSRRSWGRLALAGEHLATERSLGDGKRTGRALAGSLRDAPLLTAAGLGRGCWQHAVRAVHSDPQDVNPLRSDIGGEHARRAYLAAVSVYGTSGRAHS